MKYLIIIVIIVSFSCTSKPNKTAESNNKLIGSWISSEDSLFKISFTDSLKLDYYDKDIASTSTYSISADTLITTDKELNEVFKYTIDTLTDSTLSLIYLDRGNMLNFKRINKLVDSSERKD